MKRGDKNTEYVLSLSYGKDSMACLGAIEHLGWPLDRIVTADVWATDEIPAEYPPVVEFKKRADEIIKQRYGITVEHFCSTSVYGEGNGKATYRDGFYHVIQSGDHAGEIKGFPMQRGPWCQRLKTDATKQARKMTYERLFYHVRQSGNREGQIVGFPFVGHPECQKALKMGALRNMADSVEGDEKEVIQYLGIAADEPKRIATHRDKPGIMLPLVEIGWEEDLCGLWCKYSGLLSPTYTSSTRDGCWFCHNQGVDQLRNLRKMYPDLWALLLEWDKDSPVTFKPPSRNSPGRTVHDYERRFAYEDEGLIKPGAPFKWAMLDEPIQLTLF